jgi:hypothetical protein
MMRHPILHLAMWIISRLVRGIDRESLLGDLAEECALRASASSSSAAHRWCLRQAFASAPAPLIEQGHTICVDIDGRGRASRLHRRRRRRTHRELGDGDLRCPPGRRLQPAGHAYRVSARSPHWILRSRAPTPCAHRARSDDGGRRHTDDDLEYGKRARLVPRGILRRRARGCTHRQRLAVAATRPFVTEIWLNAGYLFYTLWVELRLNAISYSG